jgi:hypothetical protein
LTSMTTTNLPTVFIFPLQFSIYYASPHFDHHFSSFPVEKTSSLQFSSATTFYLFLLFAPSLLLSTLFIPHLCGKPKRGPVLYQNRDSMVIQPPPTPSSSPNPLPSSFGHSS